MTERIWYRRIGSAYQLAGDAITQTSLRPAEEIHTDLISLTTGGLLTVRKYYCWDGASVPAIIPMNARTFKRIHRGSLYHDALYDLMRQGWLFEPDREAADNELRRVCLEDGMPEEEAESVWRAVRDYGGPSADPHRAVAPVGAP